jgi:hypothetical protein
MALFDIVYKPLHIKLLFQVPAQYQR